MNEFKFCDISVGLKWAFTKKLEQADINQFIIISSDNNPLHTDEIYAREKKFDDIVIHGLLTTSLYSALVGVYLPGKYSLLHEINITFKNPAYCHDIFHIEGEIIYINYAYKQVEIKAFIKNQNGNKISNAKIKVGMIDE